MKHETICGIYYIKNVINNKVYIGQAVDIYNRCRSHINALRGKYHSNNHLQCAWNKYGESNFEFNIIEKCHENELDNREIYWISEYNSYYNGYNQTFGGEGSIGYKHSDDIKRKMSEIKHEQFQNIENREKLRDAHKFESEPIYQIDFNGNIIQEWPSANWASKILGYNVTRIYEALNNLNRKKTYSGYVWIYIKNYNPDLFDINWYIDRQWNYKSFYQYDLDFNFIKKWDSVIDAEKSGFNRESIYKCCSFKQKTHKGFIFRDYLIDSKDEEVDRYGNQKKCR